MLQPAPRARPQAALSRRELLRLRPARQKAQGGHWIRIRRVAMACRFEITLSDEHSSRVPAALAEAERIEAVLTVFRPSSEVHATDRLKRYANPIYLAAYEGVIAAGVLGEVHCARLAWHRNGNWKRTGEPPVKGYDPSPWGYPTWEHLLNWRLYRRYSKGLLAELASHQVSIANWFFGGPPTAVMGVGGIHRWNDGVREVDDHVYCTFEYAGGRTATFSTIESNAWDHYYEVFFGTKGTLLLRGEAEAYLFEEGGQAAAPTNVAVTPKGKGPALEASESRTADAAGAARAGSADTTDRLWAHRGEISTFCSAICVGTPLACGPERAVHSATACLRADEAVAQKTRLLIQGAGALTGASGAETPRS